MKKESRLERLRLLKTNPPTWLHLCNICLIALSFTGLVLAFVYPNAQAITVFGLGFVASLSLEVWGSCLNPEHKNEEYQEKTAKKPQNRKSKRN
nr:hypothetical protein [Candidatus Freyarchaeota archaeon]